jgi:hypothetical protein
MMHVTVPAIVAVVALAGTPVVAQEPESRAELLRQERDAKAANTKPYESGGLERALLWLESGRLFERLLNPPEGVYPKIGNVTAGSGIAIGPAYRRPGLFGQRANFSVFGLGSLTKYWMVDARLSMPPLARGMVFAEIYGQRSDFPSEDFFGLGPDSRREDHSTYGLGNTIVGGRLGVRPTPWLSVEGGIDRLAPRIGSGDEVAESRSIETVFDAATIPGLSAQPDFLRYRAAVAVNHREPRGNPRRGGQYSFTVEKFDDRDDGRNSFRRFEGDVQQYVPLLRDRRVLALRALASVSTTDTGADVPFYLQRTLGGPDDLRGFRRYRFRDRNLLLLQAEYRWEVFTAVDAAIFYDAGKVARRSEELTLRDLESDWGIGFRFGTLNGIFLRIEGAFGSRAGKHFILRFGHVF